MAKAVFRPGEMKGSEKKVMLPLVHNFEPVVEEKEEVEEEYTGPTVEELKKEVEDFKANWETEKQQLLSDAQSQADEIIKKAEEAAFAEVKRQSDSALEIKASAEKEAEDILLKARQEAGEIINQANNVKNSIEEEAKKMGFDSGHEEGYVQGKAEADRLVERMHKMIEAVMQRREEILRDTETQIVELVVLISRKVVKIISENQKNVIMANVLAALKKVRMRGEITLRVNIEDVNLTTEHTEDFIKHVENVQGITVLEDSAVEKGGCIVETDFGAIDARISSQLTELENKILEVSPVKNIKRSDSLTNVES